MTTNNKTNNSHLSTNSEISEDWYGGYKLEVDVTSDAAIKDWSLDFELPYSIDEVYGVDLAEHGNGNYTIGGQGGLQDLNAGDSLDSVFIVDDDGGKAQTPKFSNSAAENRNNLMSQPVAASGATQLSDKAISVGFEGHSHGTTYDYSAQTQDWDVGWSTQMEERASISNQESHSGNNSLAIAYPSDEQSNVGAKWQVPEQQEYYLSYWLKFEDNFDFDGDKLSGGKLPGLGTGDLASGGNKPDGSNGFTSRYMWREGGQAVLYLYHMDQEGIYGDDLLLKSSDGEEKFFEPGQWHNLVQRVKVNDGTEANGEIDVWMDNEQVLDVDNLRFVTNGQGIDTTFFSSFHGGYGSEWWPEQQGYAYFDDFVVSTNAHDVGL